MRYLPHVLAALLVVVQADLWIGKGSLREVASLERELAQQTAANAVARERNARIEAELSDLTVGLEMVEERARGDLGMLRPHEILVQYQRSGAVAAAPATPVLPAVAGGTAR